MKRGTLALCFTFLVLSTGCIGFTDPGVGVDIAFSGSFNVSDSTFEMEGDISTGGGAGGKDTYRDVVVCLYANNGQLLNSSDPKDISGDYKRISISLSSDSVPKYVIINSRDFWDVSDHRIAYYKKINTNGEILYDEQWATTPDDLPTQGCSA